MRDGVWRRMYVVRGMGLNHHHVGRRVHTVDEQYMYAERSDGRQGGVMNSAFIVEFQV